jgi:nucleolar protein 56
MMYLTTTWFGVFLCDGKKVKKSILFPRDEDEIYKRLLSISQNKVLPEEYELVKEAGESVIVNEPRLKSIGLYKPSDPFFMRSIIRSDDYNVSVNLLRKVSLRLASELTSDKLGSEDLQIIQMVKAHDDLLEVSNLLSERMASWCILPSSSDRMQGFKDLHEAVSKEIQLLEEQIRVDMEKLAPNISKLVGSLIGARLISKAGGLMRLAGLPSSTIQVLGAETALFRYKKEGGKPPKHGVIFQHPYINRALKEERGRIARMLASKISTAAKADAFTKHMIADDLLEQMDKQMKKRFQSKK